MGILIILGVLTVIFAIWTALTFVLERYGSGYSSDYMGARFICIPSLVVCVVILSIIWCDLVNKDREFNKTIYEYESMKESLNCSRDNFSDLERIQVITNIQKINETIAEHRAYVGNPWTGVFYSEKIAELEYLK